MPTRDYLLTYGSCKVASVAGGTGAYTLDSAGDGQMLDWIKVGIQVRIYGCANAANNGIFPVTAVAGHVITVTNPSSVLENPSASGRMGYPIGGTSDNVLTDLEVHSIDYQTAEVTFKFEVADQDETVFGRKLAAAESLFRTPRMDFSWLNGSTEILPLKHTDGSGFDADPKIEKREDKQTGRSRIFTVTIKFGLPADVVKTGGRRTSTVNVSYSPSRRRRVTISGTYTRVPPGTSTARAQYEAQIGAFCLTVLTALGLSATTSELGEEPSTVHNETNMTLEFTRVYDEIIFGQGGGSNDSAIVRQSFRVSRKKVAPGDTPTCFRLATLQVAYDAWIDKSVTTDLKGKYDSIRNWIVQQAQTTLGGGQAALVDDTPDYDFDDNRIHASLTLLVSTGGNIFENSVTTENYDEYGGVLVPVWEGSPLAKYDYQGPARKLKIVTKVYKVLGGGGGSGSAGGGGSMPIDGGGFGIGVAGSINFPGGGSFDIFGPATGEAVSALAAAAQGLPGADAGGGGAIGVQQGQGGLSQLPVSWRLSTTPKQMGLDGYTIDFQEITSVEVFELFSKPSGGGGGGQGSVASGNRQGGFGLGGQ